MSDIVLKVKLITYDSTASSVLLIVKIIHPTTS